MKVTCFNGSPRGVKSNSNKILTWLSEGLGFPTEIHLLKTIENHQTYIEEAVSSDTLIFVFPLYTDAMPGIVMAFFEALGRNKDKLIGKKVVFVIHSGFPESCQSEPLKNYLTGLAKKLEWQLLDIVVKGGSEAFMSMPERAMKKHKERFIAIGQAIGSREPIDELLIEKLGQPYKLSAPFRVVVHIMKKLGLLDMYFRNQLKANGALEKSFDKPYL